MAPISKHTGPVPEQKRGRGQRPKPVCCRGGRSTKIHAVVDGMGNPCVFMLTGGQVHDSIMMKGNALLRSTLVTCAHAATRNKKSYFYAQFMRISAHRGKQRAYVAVAHSMLVAIYHILKDGVVFKDLGADYYSQFNRERKIDAYLKKLKALGWKAPVVAA